MNIILDKLGEFKGGGIEAFAAADIAEEEGLGISGLLAYYLHKPIEHTNNLLGLLNNKRYHVYAFHCKQSAVNSLKLMNDIIDGKYIQYENKEWKVNLSQVKILMRKNLIFTSKLANLSQDAMKCINYLWHRRVDSTLRRFELNHKILTGLCGLTNSYRGRLKKTNPEDLNEVKLMLGEHDYVKRTNYLFSLFHEMNCRIEKNHNEGMKLVLPVLSEKIVIRSINYRQTNYHARTVLESLLKKGQNDHSKKS